MELFTRCGRCGALVGTTSETVGGASAQCVPCVVAADRGGSEYTVLCPDCMSKLKSWLGGVPEEPQEAVDSVDMLAFDMARALACAPEDCCGIRIACEYFGHSGFADCRNRESSRYGDECPASGYMSDCWDTMCASIRRRCKALGVDLGGEADEE